MITKQIKYATVQICFQEIPDEISYTYFITNCPGRCIGCHSPHLREDCGTLVSSTLEATLKRQEGICSCILFMGGDDSAQIDSLIDALHICRIYGYKTALYSGFNLEDIPDRLLTYLDYLKTGPYIDTFGPINKKTTNQRLWLIRDGKIVDNITHKFWRSLDENYS